VKWGLASFGSAHRWGFFRPEQGGDIIPPFALLYISLMGQKRGRLHEKDGKGNFGRIGYLMASIVAWLAMIWQFLPARLESFHDFAGGQWFGHQGLP
jgi:hypothetical protein